MGLGPLIELSGLDGPRCTGLPSQAVVADAIRDGNWWLHRSRSRNPINSLVCQCLPDPHPIATAEEDDAYLWKIGSNGVPRGFFSASATWKHLHPTSSVVPWFKTNSKALVHLLGCSP
ncbi:unnamed protein product [Thlaspi arvense]|uniref:Uncharacterized protein n=1 Tax=Thlaspi arvense TaxID=13288 RepID=A0AAU9T9W6_THLAR|nr:unnamed protein product [Thlaspi arvense]